MPQYGGPWQLALDLYPELVSLLEGTAFGESIPAGPDAPTGGGTAYPVTASDTGASISDSLVKLGSHFAALADTLRAAGVPATDAFQRVRSVGTGWGTADTGQAWTHPDGGNAKFGTDGNFGQMACDVASAIRSARLPMLTADTDTIVSFVMPPAPVGGNQSMYALGRFADASNRYGVRLTQNTNGSFVLALSKRVAGVTSDSLVVQNFVAGSFTPGNVYWLKFRAVGQSLYAKVWSDAVAEPAGWNLSIQDPDLTGTGAGVLGFPFTGNTILPTVTWDNFSAAPVVDSALLQVTRSLIDTLPSVTDTVVPKNTCSLTDTGASISDSILEVGFHFVSLSDTGSSVSDSIAAAGVRVRTVTDSFGATVVDDFNRPDGALGSSWFTWNTAFIAHQPFVSGNKAFGYADAPDNGGYWATQSFPADQFSQAVVPGAISVNAWLGVVVRVDATGANLYNVIYFRSGASSYELRLYRKTTGGTYTQIGSTFSLGSSPLNPGDVLRIEAQGTTIRAFVNGTQRISTTDSTIASGKPGIAFFAGTDPLDNWVGGSLVGDSVASTAIPGRSVTDTLTSITDSLVKVAAHFVSLADTAATISDSVTRAGSGARSVTDSLSISDTVALRVSRFLTDTGAVVSDALASLRRRFLTDTGSTVSDTITAQERRALADTAVTISEQLLLKITRVLTDTGATISDAAVRAHVFPRSLTDTLTSITESMTRKVLRTLADTAVTISDSVSSPVATGSGVGAFISPPATDQYGRFYFVLPALPSIPIGLTVLELGTATVGTVGVDPTGHVFVRDSAGGVASTVATVALNTLYRVEWHDDHTGGGHLTARLYAGDSLTLLEQVVQNGPVGSSCNEVFFGITPPLTGFTVYLGGFAWNQTTWPGPLVAAGGDLFGALRVTRVLTDDGVAISDSINGGGGQATRFAVDSIPVSDGKAALRVIRPLSDVGATVIDTPNAVRMRAVVDTLTFSESLAKLRSVFRACADTVPSITDSLLAKAPKTPTDVGAAISDAISSSRLRVLSDVGAAVSDAPARVRRVLRSVSDTVPSVTDSLAGGRSSPIFLTDTGASVSDEIQNPRTPTITDTLPTIIDHIAAVRRYVIGLTDGLAVVDGGIAGFILPFAAIDSPTQLALVEALNQLAMDDLANQLVMDLTRGDFGMDDSSTGLAMVPA